jgi:site-specific DNA-methyltransferase (adenine-specific)/adenine-specific DNA-methyltransferase
MMNGDDRKRIIELLEAGKPIPEIYKSKLFPSGDKEYIEVTKEYQLVYKGKGRKEDIIADTPEAPLQEVRGFNNDNPFDDDWRNMLIFGDNLMALKTIYEDQRGTNILGTKNKIKLIYIDPPFATKQDFMKDREKAYRDKIKGAQFIEFLRKRLILLREVLADDGSIYVHLDWKKGHYAKILLDEIFQPHNFRNEIIWKRTTARSDSGNYNHIHDAVFFFSKSENFIWNTQHTAYTESYLKSNFKKDEHGRLYRETPLTASETRMGYSGAIWRGVDPNKIGKGRHWSIPKFVRHLLSEKATKNSLVALDELSNIGRIIWAKDGEGRPNIKQYADEIEGVEIQSIWSDFGALSSNAPEATNYPTQKPEQLLGRIIKASSNPNDIVLDAFAGSGTTLAVAEKLGRRWIGIDCGKLAIYTIQKRMLNLTTQVGSAKKDERKPYERVNDFDEHAKNSHSILFINEKAKKGELEITDTFLDNLHKTVSQIQKKGDFSIICPEEKFKVKTFEEDEEGRKFVRKDNIRYVISFIEPKEKTEKEKPLKAKTFTLFNAGIYDSNAILNLGWAHYREFVVKLFEVREERHTINGFQVDGYVGVHSAYIWDYPNHKTLKLDEGYVESLHKVLGGKAGERFYVVAPVISFSFMMDEITHGDTTYVFLKVPISVLYRLIEKGEIGAFKQPVSENDVNEVIDAVGFDFISQPIVKIECLRMEPPKIDLLNKDQKDYVIRIKEFKSDTLLSSPEDFHSFETLSMVLVDYNFDGNVFKLEQVFWAEDLVNAELKRKGISSNLKLEERVRDCDYLELRITEDQKWEMMMVIFIDKYGNEKKQVFKKEDFKEERTC